MLAAVAALALGAVAALATAWRMEPGVVEAYASWVSPTLVRLVASASGRVPFGLTELAMVVGVTWLVWPLPAALLRLRSAGSARDGAVRLARGLGATALRAALIAGWFYAAWGLNYARAPLVERQGWTALATAARPADADLAELVDLATAWVGYANDAYLALHGRDDAGRPTALADAAAGDADDAGRPTALADAGDGGANADWAAVDAALDEGFRAASGELREGPAFAVPRGPTKPVRLSAAMSAMRLAGFFFPWTGEANVNQLMPPYQLPHTMAHEKAHQRGIASEDEANFVGFLAAILSPSPLARYSGQLFAQRQLLRELCARDAAACERHLAKRLPGVQRDVDDGRAYWARFDGPAADVHERVNDAYLTFNGVEGGVDSYDESARLIVVWARSGGRMAMGTAGSGPGVAAGD